MENNPTVSVCMITYGHEKFIEQAIHGVLMQETSFEIELVIVNDCSPDATDLLVQDILINHPKASSIKYTKQQQNIGMMPNFVFALKECKGKYIALCEGDDYWTDPLKLQKQVNFLEANEEYVLCFHKVKILKLNGELVDDFITNVPENYETQETLARLGNYIHTPSVVFRNVIKVFPPEFSLSPIGDYFLYIQIVEFGKIKYLEEKMAVYRYGIGFFSGFDRSIKEKKWIKTLLLIISSTKNETVKGILLNKLNQYFKLDNFELVVTNEGVFSRLKSLLIQFIPPIFFLLKNKLLKK